MGETKIQWTDVTWNPVRGCSRVSPGCGGAAGEGGCYAERQAARFSGPGGAYHGLVRIGKQGPRWTGQVRLVESQLPVPLHWRKPRRVFVNSMSDLFHEGLSDEDIAAVFGVMAATPQHTYQVLTKRAERMRDWFEWMSQHGDISVALREAFCHLAGGNGGGVIGARLAQYALVSWPLPNVWLGCSVEDQQRADERIPLLLETPAAVRFVSAEPLLGPVDLFAFLAGDLRDRSLSELRSPPMPGLDWVIVGGESGPGARRCSIGWIRSILEQCQAAGTPVFCKQIGSWLSTGHSKGGDPSEWPEDLRVRQWPEVTRD